MIHRRRTLRSAFSLLEMVIALALGMFLLLALYVTLTIFLGVSETGRGTLGESGVARYLASRIATDVANHLGAVDPRMPEAVTTTSSSSSSKTTKTEPAPMVDAESVNFNVGVSGDATNLILSVYRVQKTASDQDPASPDSVIVSDVRRVCYWLVMNGPEPIGIARAEFAQATSIDVDTWPSELAEQEKHVVADEVKNIAFSYFDPASSSWVSEWNGSTSFAEGAPPVGPPAAIRITITMRKSLDRSSDQYREDGAVYTHVVALPTANAFVGN